MKNLITISIILSTIILTSCQDCKDCQSSTAVNLNIEYFTLDSLNNYNITSTKSYSYTGNGTVGSTSALASDTINEIMLSNYFSPILTQEFCGQTLKDNNNNSTEYEFTTGDTITGLFKYTWTETWDCQ
jgi:hypothetical protein